MIGQEICEHTKVSSMQDYEKINILVVDDEPSICIAVTEMLEMSGFHAEFVNKASDVIPCLDKNPDIDIMLLDINLGPGVSGMDLLPAIREHYKYVQIIMLTSRETLEAGLECMKRGAFDYMTKPFDEDAFQRVVPMALEKKRTERLNDLYTGILVHDLKNPLQCISGAIEFLRDSLDGRMNNTQERFMRLLDSSAKQIGSMIDNILSVSKFESGKIKTQIEEFLLKDELEHTFKFFENSSTFPDKRISINGVPLEQYRVGTDRGLFSKVLVNIVGNAIRFTPEDGDIGINFSEVNGSDLQVSVSNTGSYIEEHLRDAIFNKFASVQYDNKSARTQNYGLGLTYSKLAVKELGGRIWVESDKHIPRTTFHFTIKNQKAGY
ncbi:MAG: response regulator [Chitinivibrionales bacterium]|nr:response regulator [Chitinivibrionales bacterium]